MRKIYLWICTVCFLLFGCTKTLEEKEIIILKDKTQASVLTADFFEVKNYHLFEYDAKRSGYPPFEIFNDTNSAYYSWLTTFNELEVVAKEICINLPGENILKINESFEEKYQMAYIKNTHKSTPVFSLTPIFIVLIQYVH